LIICARLISFNTMPKIKIYFPAWLVYFCFFTFVIPQAEADESKQLLVGYNFDEALLEVGPDTFQIFKHTHGTVGLSHAYKYSGARSLKIQDVANDGGFPELQGYFETVTEGSLYFHFAFMMANTHERFNIALAGKSHFRLKNHGIGFWLNNDEGNLRHYVDHKPVSLFPLQPFVWYQVDLDYDISAGRYDLSIKNEYGETLVDLIDQKNAVNQPGSTVNKFSFIGDLEDQQNASYYVDDVMLHSQKATNQLDFVAPGRRKLFVDIWDDYHKKMYGKIQCLPGVRSIDFGIDIDVFNTLVASNYYDLLNQLLENQRVEPGDWQDNPFLSAIYSWQKGCSSLKQKDWPQAIASFTNASNLVNTARLYSLSLALAYAGGGDFQQSDMLLASIQSEWVDDQRLSVAYAMIGISRRDLFSAEQWLAQSALGATQGEGLDILKGLHGNIIDKNTITMLKNYDPEGWPLYLEQAVITEQYYFTLLWEKNYYDAYYFAKDMLSKLQALGIESGKWQERAGDAAFYNKAYDEAIYYYQSALAVAGACYCNYLKLADVYHITGNSEKERSYREKIYGKFENTD
jgi:hypothetical protein